MRRRIWYLSVLVPILLLPACGGSSGTATTAASSSSASTSSTAATTTTAGASTTAEGSAASNATIGSTSSGSGVTFTLDQSQSQALYKARETLANIGSPSEAVGKTSQVTGTITFKADGTIDPAASKITIDLSTLQSDKSQRDNYIKGNTLETNKYPNAVFVPTSVKGLTWPLPTSGQTTFTLIGDLTVHGKAALTTWNVNATFAPDQVNGAAVTTVKFEDFGMKPPKTMLVISVDDNLTLELDFVFTPGS